MNSNYACLLSIHIRRNVGSSELNYLEVSFESRVRRGFTADDRSIPLGLTHEPQAEFRFQEFNSRRNALDECAKIAGPVDSPDQDWLGFVRAIRVRQ